MQNITAQRQQTALLEENLNIPEYLKYNKADEWMQIEADVVTIGITDYAQGQLSDVVFAEIKAAAGEVLERGKLIAVIESVKASSDISLPLSGKVLEINEEVISTPEIINSDPYGQAWLVKIQLSNPAEVADLLNSADYQAFRNQ